MYVKLLFYIMEAIRVRATMNTFIHSTFNKYLSSAAKMPGVLVGPGDITLN